QIPETPPELTVAEYVLLGRTPYLGYFGAEGRADRLAAERALERLELRPFAERHLGSLSGGELQRAVLARAVAQEAPILLLDEPTTALDLGRQQQALELVHSLRDDGLTIVSTMHDLTLAGQYADRLARRARAHARRGAGRRHRDRRLPLALGRQRLRVADGRGFVGGRGPCSRCTAGLDDRGHERGGPRDRSRQRTCARIPRRARP